MRNQDIGMVDWERHLYRDWNNIANQKHDTDTLTVTSVLYLCSYQAKKATNKTKISIVIYQKRNAVV